MKIQVQKTGPPVFPSDAWATVTEAGNIVKVTLSSHHNLKQTIQLLEGGDEYIVISSGEVKEVEHKETRAQNMASVRTTFQKLSMLINANTSDPTKCRFVTLTYAENMQDTRQLYTDFVLFVKRFRYFCEQQKYGKVEYIAVVEPQQRGAWHLHVILIFKRKAPFIANDTLKDLWGLGFVHVRSIDNVDNVGAYLCAYLTDLELPDCDSKDMELLENAFTITEHEVDGKKKRFIKGGRLHLYPAGMNIYRCSRGVKRPIVRKMKLGEAEKLTGDMVKTYEKTVELSNPEADFETTIYTQYFNKIRPGKTANGFNSETFGPMQKVVLKRPEKPKDTNKKPIPFDEFEKEISDEDFNNLLNETRNTNA